MGIFQRTRTEAAMPAIDDEDRPKRKIVHEIGQELALLSVKEIDERVALLKEEIARLEAAKAGKQASRNVADTFFKK
jgi:uncharacterized small protein (DUF1192 family)